MGQEERYERAARDKGRAHDVAHSPPDTYAKAATFDPKQNEARGREQRHIVCEKAGGVASPESISPEVDRHTCHPVGEISPGLRDGQQERNQADRRVNMPQSHAPILARSGGLGQIFRPSHRVVLNQSWPPNDGARGLIDHASINVTVRVVFERDGETWLDGVATRWSGRHVFVRVEDSRLRVQFVWVDAADVRRR